MTTAVEWFSDEYEFRQLCGDAQSLARSEGDQEFAAQMMLKANQYGLDTYITVKQLAWLCRIADHEMPAQRTAVAR
jgi:hypothetical protein